MHKKLLTLFLVMLLLLTTVAYADTIDLNQMDFLFDQIRQAEEGKKTFYIDVFNYFFGSDDNIDYLIDNFRETIRAEDLEKMKSLGISETDVKNNLENLKTWDKSDRLKLIDYAIMEDQVYAKEQIKLLNDKYAVKHEENTVEDGIANDGVNIGTVPSETEQEQIIDEEKKGLKEKLQSKGLIVDPIEIVNENKRFIDTENHWSKEYVNFFAERNIINGRTEEKFEPDGFIKESEIIKLLMVIIVQDSELLESENVQLSDNNKNQWYSEYLRQAKKLNIISDSQDLVSIDAEAYPNREKIIHLIIKTLKVLEIPIDEKMKEYKGDFADFDQVDEAYKESLIIAHNLGLIHGNANGTLTPKREITRGEVSKIMNGFYKLIISELY